MSFNQAMDSVLTSGMCASCPAMVVKTSHSLVSCLFIDTAVNSSFNMFRMICIHDNHTQIFNQSVKI